MNDFMQQLKNSNPSLDDFIFKIDDSETESTPTVKINRTQCSFRQKCDEFSNYLIQQGYKWNYDSGGIHQYWGIFDLFSPTIISAESRYFEFIDYFSTNETNLTLAKDIANKFQEIFTKKITVYVN